MKIKLFCLMILILLSFASFKPIIALESFDLADAKSAILIDSKTGNILYEKNIHERRVPASMTKVMSLILICEAIKDKRINLNTIITASEYAASMGGSQIYLKTGEQFTLDEMLKAICVASANDCVVAVAEHIYGSEKLFVDKMNEFANFLNLENTFFSDSTGLSKENHYTSAYDMGKMSSYLINHYGTIILKYTSLREDYLRKDTDNPFWLVNTNKLVGKVEGVDGLKTGWLGDVSGYCLTVTSKRNNMRLIAVLMGYEKALKRNTDAVALLNYGFANYEEKILFEKGKVIYTVDDLRYSPSKFNVILQEEVTKICKKGSENAEISWEIIEYPQYESHKAGLVKLYYGDEYLGEFAFNSEIPIAKNSFFQLWWNLMSFCI